MRFIHSDLANKQKIARMREFIIFVYLGFFTSKALSLSLLSKCTTYMNTAILAAESDEDKCSTHTIETEKLVSSALNNLDAEKANE